MPSAPDMMSIQPESATAVQTQVAPVVTVMLPLPPSLGNDALCGSIAYVQTTGPGSGVGLGVGDGVGLGVGVGLGDGEGVGAGVGLGDGVGAGAVFDAASCAIVNV